MQKRDRFYRRIWDWLPLPGRLRVLRLSRQLERLRRKGRYDEMVATFANLIDHPVDGPYIAPYIADRLLLSADPDLERIRALMAIKPAKCDFAPYWFCRARVYHRLGDSMGALSSFALSLPDASIREEVLALALPLAANLPSSDAKEGFYRALVGLPSGRLIADFLTREEVAHADSRPPFCIKQILSVHDGISAGYGDLRSLGDPEIIRLSSFQADGTPAHEKKIISYSPYVAEIHHATLVSGSSLVHVGNAAVLSDLLADWELARFVSLKSDPSVVATRNGAVLLRHTEPCETLAEGINLTGTFSCHYGHWFAEYLPRLRHFSHHPRFAEVPIIVDAGMPASHYEFLRALAPNRLHVLPVGASLKVDRLWVAPTINFFPPELIPNHEVPDYRQAAWSVGALRFFAERLRPNLTAHGSRRLFLSRRNSIWRRLANEQELIAALAPLGFEVICLEEMSFADQLEVFAEAGFIIAPNGSALNNLIFASPRTKVIVFGQHHFHNWGGWLGPFQDLGYDPVFITGSPLQSAGEKHADYVISVEEALSTVHRLLTEP